MKAATKRRRQHETTCPDCNGDRTTHAVTLYNRYGEACIGQQQRPVDCETCGSTGKVKLAVCGCCRAPGARLCAACKAAHTSRNVYLAALTCPVRDEADRLDGEMQEAMRPGSTLAPRNGHSEECWHRLPHEGIDPAVVARCPKCSVPTSTSAPRVLPRNVLAMDFGVGPRSGQGRR